MHQWCSGARPVDQEVIDYCQSLLDEVVENVRGENDCGWDDHDIQNLETSLRYLKTNQDAVVAKGNDVNTVKTLDGAEITYAAIRSAMLNEAFDMKLVDPRKCTAVALAVNQGIDSHLEACFVPDRGDSYGTRKAPQQPGSVEDFPVMYCTVSIESFPVLVRRLYKLDCDDAKVEEVALCLADSMLYVLGFDEYGKFVGRNEHEKFVGREALGLA